MRLVALAFASALIAMTGCRCSIGERPGGCGPASGEVRVAMASMPNTLDWSASSASSAENYPVLLAMNHGLTRLDASGHVAPGLAEKWDVELLDGTEPQRQRYTFHLRAGLKWSDGETPVTAQDFAFGWRRALLGHEPAEFSDVVGADEVLRARPSGDPVALESALRGFLVEAVNDSTLRVTLRSPRSYFLARLANVYTFFPQPSVELAHRDAEALRRYFHVPENGRPLVTGAFRVVAWDRLGRTVRLDRNPHDPFAPAERAVSRLLLVEAPLSPILYERCQVDFLFMDDPATLQKPPPDTDRTALLSTYWLGVNATRTPLPLRRAIAHAIDRATLVEGLWPHVRLATHYLPPEMPGAPVADDPAFASYPAFDPEKARALVKEADDGTELTLLVRNSRTFLPEKAIADGVRRQLEAVGLKVRVVETSNFSNEIQGPDGSVRHALFLKRVGADYAHPQTLFTPFQKGGINYTDFGLIDGGREQAAFQALLDEGAVQIDPESARATWARAEALLVGKNVVVIPLVHPERYFRRRSWVGGLGVDPFNFLTLASLHVAAPVAGVVP